MNMEISDRDKQLIYIVAIIAIIAAAFFFGFKNFSDRKDEYKAQTQQYNDEYAALIEHQKNREEYKRMTTQYNEDREVILANYEDGYNQENMIKTINDIEQQDGVWISELAFAMPSDVYTFTSMENTFGVRNTTNIDFEASYTGFKDFLNSLLNIRSKTKINSVSVSYDEATQLLTGSVSIDHFSVATPASTGPTVNIDLPTGVGNIFDSDAVISNTHTQAANGSYILTDYDACVIISPDKSTLDAVIVGTTNDSAAKDSLSTDDNDTAELTIIFAGSDGKYTISYMLGDKQYPAKNFEKGVSFEPGNTLDLLVVSSLRDDNKDKVAVKANIINNTDMELNVLVSGDDTSSPRFSAVKREGEITIYR